MVHNSHLVVKFLDGMKSATSPFLGISKLISEVVIRIYIPINKCIADEIFLTRRTKKSLKWKIEGTVFSNCNFFLFYHYLERLPSSCLKLGFCQPVLLFVVVVLRGLICLPRFFKKFFYVRLLVFA